VRAAAIVAGAVLVIAAVRFGRQMAARGLSPGQALAELVADARLALDDGRRAAGERRLLLEAELADPA
jgi:hypothetical protein